MRLMFMTFVGSLALMQMGCVSRGSTVKKLGDDVYEVRAWDGYGCLKTSDNNTCFTLLMPIIRNKAEEKCEGTVDSITPCLRYEAMTADRIFCRVHCSPDDVDENDIPEEADTDETGKKKKKEKGR